MTPTILVLGAGEHASASAHRLFRCGYRVVMTDLERPRAVRRLVSFCTALTDGEITVEGVRGVRHELTQAASLASFDWRHVPVFVDPDSTLVTELRPDVLVDARLLKASVGCMMRDAPLTIALGPGPVAGRDVRFVIETERGHDLGRIIERGPAAADTGEPGKIGGYTHERVLRAPAAGTLEGTVRIGALVEAGQQVGRVAAEPIVARVAGVVRGLPVTAGQKVGDVDPRGEPRYCATISDKARTISGSVLEVVARFVCDRAP